MEFEDQIRKIRRLEELQNDIYPEKTQRNIQIGKILENFSKFAQSKKVVTLAGRIRALRLQGAIGFCDLEDFSGRIQIIFKKEKLGDRIFEILNFLDLGDFLQISGRLIFSKTKQESIEAKNFKIISKTLRPLPKEYYAPQDVEERLRRRYLDLLYGPELKEDLILRSKTIATLRQLLAGQGFLEVETPILQTTYGGALARPFRTKLETLDLPLYLRIAPELYLKRLLVAGFEKIFEIGKNFRNEGIDKEHNPEFTMMELYWAYQNRNGLMDFIQELIQKLTKKILNSQTIEFNKQKINLKTNWPRYDYAALLKKETGLDYFSSGINEFLKKAKELNIKLEAKIIAKWKVADELFKKSIRPSLIQPTFIINHPLDLSPLAKKDPEDKRKTLRFQLFIAGMEIVNGFSELNDPIDQKERFEKQQKELKAGETEAHPFDKDFVEALEYAMPPTAGLGLGIDRLIMFLTNNQNIRDVILFPFIKPKQ